MDELDKLTDHLTLPQKMALAKCVAAIMQIDAAKKRAAQTPGDVAFTRPAADLFKTPDTPE